MGTIPTSPDGVMGMTPLQPHRCALIRGVIRLSHARDAPDNVLFNVRAISFFCHVIFYRLLPPHFCSPHLTCLIEKCRFPITNPQKHKSIFGGVRHEETKNMRPQDT